MPSTLYWLGVDGNGTTTSNWSTGANPATGDTVVFDGRGASAMTSGLSSAGVLLAKLITIKGSKPIGTATTPWAIGATIAEINRPPTDGSSPPAASNQFFNFGTNANTTTVWDSASQGLSGLEPVILKGTHTSNKLFVYGGIVGLATLIPGDVANYPTITVEAKSPSGVTRAVIGEGCTAPTTLTVLSAEAVLRVGATTINTEGGTLTTEGSGAITTANINGAAYLNSTGTITTLNIEDNGAVSTLQTARAATITTTNMYGGGTLSTDLNTTFTNGVNSYRGARGKLIDYPDGINVAFSAAP